MSTMRKSAVFLAITFALSWVIAIGGWALNLHIGPAAVLMLTLMMAGPAAAAVICVFIFEKGRRAEALGLRFQPNWWWLYAWLAPLAIGLVAVLATVLLTERTLVDVGETTIAAVAAQSPAQAEELRAIPQLGLVIILFAVIVGTVINAPILTVTEELGWRGYLYDLWRPFGFWRASLGAGFVWGVWHAPAILLYGLNYPDHPRWGVAIFVVFCLLLAPLITLVRERGGSVVAAGIFHGTLNAIGGLTLASLSDPSFPWNGVVGIGGFLALALAVALVAWRFSPALAPRADGA